MPNQLDRYTCSYRKTSSTTQRVKTVVSSVLSLSMIISVEKIFIRKHDFLETRVPRR